MIGIHINDSEVPYMETCEIDIVGQKAVVTRWGENDYDVFFEDDDYSVRGTLGEIVDTILASAAAGWRRVVAGFLKGEP